MLNRSHRRFVIVGLMTLSAAGCMGTRVDNKIEVVGHSETQGMDPIASAAYWGTRYDRTPTDPKVAVSFSKALRAVDNNEEALRVIKHAAIRIGSHPDVLLEEGKTLIANDRPHEAIRPIEKSISMGNTDDWSAYSALGVAYDKIGKHRHAIQQYDTALTLAPNKAQVLNNKGLSYAMAGKAG
ncbi:MAG: tetratricopeptide repeat protein, partial [Pseudomonadota bacterium]